MTGRAAGEPGDGLPDEVAREAVAAYDAIVADETAQLVLRLDALGKELSDPAGSPETPRRIHETLAALRALGRLVVRFGEEVEQPCLNARLTRRQSEQLTSAVHRYEKSIGRPDR
jgi:hypothetical protein